MSHTPFILAAYGMAVVLMAWCAFTPVLQGRRQKRFIRSRIDNSEEHDAPHT